MNCLELKGLDGSNPLGMLAALGVLRVATDLDAHCTLQWVHADHWYPCLQSTLQLPALAEEVARQAKSLATNTTGQQSAPAAQRKVNTSKAELKKAITDQKETTARARVDAKAKGLKKDEFREYVRVKCRALDDSVVRLKLEVETAQQAFTEAMGVGAAKLGDVIRINSSVFRVMAEKMTGALTATTSLDVDLMSAFGSDAVRDGDCVQPSAFSFSNGGSGKCLLKDFRACALAIDPSKCVRTLTAPWLCQDDVTSLCWDPAEQRSYALQWSDPQAGASSEAAAQVMAFMGLSLLPASPGNRRLQTTGFDRGNGAWTWPLWVCSASMQVVRSLLASAYLADSTMGRAKLKAIGVAEVFSARRINPNGKRLYFAPSQAL